MNDESDLQVKVKKEVVVLTEVSATKIAAWLDQIRLKKKGVQISRKDLINWLIEKTPEVLPTSDLNSVISKFYDEEVFLRQLLREVRKARSEGHTDYSLDLVVKSKRTDSRKEDESENKDDQSGPMTNT